MPGTLLLSSMGWYLRDKPPELLSLTDHKCSLTDLRIRMQIAAVVKAKSVPIESISTKISILKKVAPKATNVPQKSVALMGVWKRELTPLNDHALFTYASLLILFLPYLKTI